MPKYKNKRYKHTYKHVYRARARDVWDSSDVILAGVLLYIAYYYAQRA